jgi:hypothetical protein
MKKLLLLFLIIPAALLAVGQAGSMLTFTQTESDVVAVPYNVTMNTLAGNYTIEAWINTTYFTGYPRIMDRENVFAFFLDASGKLGFRGNDFAQMVLSPINTLAPGWHHVAARGVNNAGIYTVTLFCDGVSVGSGSHASFNLPTDQTTDLTIGNRALATLAPFDGSIDEIRIWNIARTNAEISSNRGRPLLGTELGLIAYYKMDEGTGQVVYDATANNLDGYLGANNTVEVIDPAWAASTAPIGFNLWTPNGPGSLTIAAPLTITWAANPALAQVNILYSPDAGTSWKIIGSRVANNGTLNTFVPGEVTNFALFRVANPDSVAAGDDSDNVMSFTDPGGWKSTITKEAENGVLAEKMYTSVDGQAFGCSFVFSKKENVGTCEIEFNIATAGLYTIWCRTRAVGGSANSFFWKVDGGAEKVMDTEKKDTWIWETLSDRGNQPGYPYQEVDPVIFNFSAGTHKIKFRARETHCRLDEIKITNDLAKNIETTPSAWIELLSPKGGQKIVRNTDYEIKWRSYNVGSKVSIQYHFGRFFTNGPVLLAHNINNTGSFIWHVQDDTCTDAFIRISAGEPGTCPVDQNHNEFEIINPPPSITVVSPNGGEKWLAKSTQTITWTNQYFSNKVNVLLSFDNGDTWKTLAGNINNTGTFTYTVPDTSADSCLVKVADKTTGTPNDRSNWAFTIYPEIKVTTPNGGETFQAQSTQPVGWTTKKYTGKVNVFYSINNGKVWNPLATNQASSDTIDWTIPNTPADSCLVKVAGAGDGLPMDKSDLVFKIVPKPVEPPPVTKDYALYFDGSNDYVEIPSAPSLNVSEKFTIEFWLKTSTPAQKWTRIMEKGSWDEYYLGFYGNAGKMSGALRTAIPGGSAMTTPMGPSTTVLGKDKWYHVAATFDGTTAKLYINGNEETSKSATALPRSLVNALILGAKKSTMGTEYHYQGYLDEVRIWNVVRSKVDITANMYNLLAGSEAGLMAYYPFNEGSGQVAGDKTANANGGRLGSTTGVDTADPAWVESNKPTSAAAEVTQLAKAGAEVTAALPTVYNLEQNYPNPFNAGTTIYFEIPDQKGQAVEAAVEIYDVSGRLINSLWHGTAQAGRHQVYWNGADNEGQTVSSGMYFYRLRAGEFAATKRMIMIK